MKFKLIENRNSGLKNESTIDTLNEKYWIEASTNAPDSEPFYFYCTDDKVKKDLYSLLPSAKGNRKGTFKQQLNKEIVSELQKDYNLMKNKFRFKFSTKGIDYDDIPDKERILTLSDRQLRQDAHNLGKEASGLNNVIVHHIDGKEHNNDKSNLLIFDSSNDIKTVVAKTGHLLAHFKSGLTPMNIGTDVYSYNSNENRFEKSYIIKIEVQKV